MLRRRLEPVALPLLAKVLEGVVEAALRQLVELLELLTYSRAISGDLGCSRVLSWSFSSCLPVPRANSVLRAPQRFETDELNWTAYHPPYHASAG